MTAREGLPTPAGVLWWAQPKTHLSNAAIAANSLRCSRADADFIPRGGLAGRRRACTREWNSVVCAQAAFITHSSTSDGRARANRVALSAAHAALLFWAAPA